MREGGEHHRRGEAGEEPGAEHGALAAGMADAVGGNHSRHQRRDRDLERAAREQAAERREHRGPEQRRLAVDEEAHEQRAERPGNGCGERLRHVGGVTGGSRSRTMSCSASAPRRRALTRKSCPMSRPASSTTSRLRGRNLRTLRRPNSNTAAQMSAANSPPPQRTCSASPARPAARRAWKMSRWVLVTCSPSPMIFSPLRTWRSTSLTWARFASCRLPGLRVVVGEVRAQGAARPPGMRAAEPRRQIAELLGRDAAPRPRRAR